MDESPAASTTTTEDALSRPNVGRDVLVVGTPIVVLGAAGTLVGLGTLEGGALVNLGYVLALAVGAVVLSRQGSSWRELGLATPASWPKTVVLGVGAGLGAILTVVAVQLVVPTVLIELGSVGAAEADVSRFDPIAGNTTLFLLMVGLAWTTIAFGEELFYRAFLLSRFVDHAGLSRWGAISLAGAMFGLVHFAEGPVGILSNGAFGVLFGWLYLRSGRNLWITVVGHGLINTLRFALLYVGAV